MLLKYSSGNSFFKHFENTRWRRENRNIFCHKFLTCWFRNKQQWIKNNCPRTHSPQFTEVRTQRLSIKIPPQWCSFDIWMDAIYDPEPGLTSLPPMIFTPIPAINTVINIDSSFYGDKVIICILTAMNCKNTDYWSNKYPSNHINHFITTVPEQSYMLEEDVCRSNAFALSRHSFFLHICHNTFCHNQ